MTQKNKILVGCLALLLALSVGYALFSDTITINGTATAKGSFDITVSKVDKEYAENYFSTWYYDNYENPDMKIVDDVMSTSVTLKNPGAAYSFAIKMENTGDIPAILNNIKDLTNNKIIYDRETKTYGDSTYLFGETSNQMSASLYHDCGLLVGDFSMTPEDGTRMICGAPGVEPDFYDAILNPGESVYFFVVYEWDIESSKPGAELNLTWDIQIDWKQVVVN